jgi:ABC-type dipeptide/oligopeptide/nickel transport system permease component
MIIWRFIARRIAFSVVTVLATAILTFVLVRTAPGDLAFLISGEGAPREYLAQIRREYGLDLPLHEQLAIY